MTQHEIEERVRRSSWPGLSPDLRDRVLSSAVLEAHSISWSDRMWFSRGWRAAAMAAATAIVILDQVNRPSPVVLRPTAQVIAEAQAIEETARQAGLPPAAAASLSRRVLSGPARAHTPRDSATELLQAFELDQAGGTR